MRHHALDKGPLPTHTCPLENLTTFPGNRRTKVPLILELVSPHIHFLSKLTRTSVLQSAPPKVERICNRSETGLIKLCRFVYFRQIRLVSASVIGGPKTACDVICHTEFKQNFPFFHMLHFF